MIQDSTRQRFYSLLEAIPISGCWLWIGCVGPKGYGAIGVLGKNYRAHRLSWIIHHGEIPKDLYVLHHCDVPCCVNPNHLFLGTQLDNIRDMDRKSRCVRHDLTPYNKMRAKLNEYDIIAIRNSNDSQAALARKYSVSQPTIWSIKNFRKWKDVPRREVLHDH